MKAALMVQQFDVAGRLVTVLQHGSGNVNDTYLAVVRTTFSEERFIVQKINRNVFPQPDSIMANMRVLTEHVHARLEKEAHLSDRIWQLPRIIPAKNGDDFVIDGDGEYWRAISHIASATSYENVQSLEHAYEAGFVLGQFQRLISDIPVSKLKDTLAGFHITPGYLKQLDLIRETEEAGIRLESVSEAGRCLRFIEERREWCSVLEDAKESGELHIRPVHGDPKIANVMIDDMTGKGTCIVDLDTVKPGLIHYDIGDCLRSACNPVGEETGDLSAVRFDEDLFQAIMKGYMTFAREFLTDADKAYLFDCIRLLAFELGLRFFTDYLDGDRYFKVSNDMQNLNRARVQFRLCECIEAGESPIRKMLEEIS